MQAGAASSGGAGMRGTGSKRPMQAEGKGGVGLLIASNAPVANWRPVSFLHDCQEVSALTGID
jgi:hypothetical protein